MSRNDDKKSLSFIFALSCFYKWKSNVKKQQKNCEISMKVFIRNIAKQYVLCYNDISRNIGKIYKNNIY